VHRDCRTPLLPEVLINPAALLMSVAASEEPESDPFCWGMEDMLRSSCVCRRSGLYVELDMQRLETDFALSEAEHQ